MPFFQSPPSLPDLIASDRVLRSYLARVLPPDVLRDVTPELEAMSALSSGELASLLAADPKAEPRLVSWDPWGNRIDHIETTPLGKRCGSS